MAVVVQAVVFEELSSQALDVASLADNLVQRTRGETLTQKPSRRCIESTRHGNRSEAVAQPMASQIHLSGTAEWQQRRRLMQRRCRGHQPAQRDELVSSVRSERPAPRPCDNCAPLVRRAQEVAWQRASAQDSNCLSWGAVDPSRLGHCPQIQRSTRCVVTATHWEWQVGGFEHFASRAGGVVHPLLSEHDCVAACLQWSTRASTSLAMQTATLGVCVACQPRA